jgi:hypothetical protein
MKIIKLKESQLINLVNKIINELDTTNSYINKHEDPTNIKKTNIFANSPKSEFIDYGIQFLEVWKNYYEALFLNPLPDEFYDYISKFDDEIQKEIKESIRTIYIEASGEFNRIHFREGIHPYLKGIGFGYIIYEAFVKFLGYASSSENATSDSRKIWKKLLNDPDFHGIVCGDENRGNVLIFDKNFNGDIPNIAKQFLHQHCKSNPKIDNSLLDLNPKLNDYINKKGVGD